MSLQLITYLLLPTAYLCVCVHLSVTTIYRLSVMFCVFLGQENMSDRLCVCGCVLVSVHMLFFFCLSMCIYNAVLEAQLTLQQICTLQAPVWEHMI